MRTITVVAILFTTVSLIPQQVARLWLRTLFALRRESGASTNSPFS
jgi:hypothetical protein